MPSLGLVLPLTTSTVAVLMFSNVLLRFVRGREGMAETSDVT